MEPNLMNSAIVFGIFPVLLGLWLDHRHTRARLAVAQAEARTDALTGALNGRAWRERTERLQALGAPFAFALFDVANLKAMNAALGHHGADEVLRELAALFRSGEFLGFRTGGDEFALVLDHGGLDAARRARDRIEAGFGERAVAPGVLAFVSGAVGTWRPGVELGEALRAADAELEARKAAKKATLGLPATREATLASLAAACASALRPIGAGW